MQSINNLFLNDGPFCEERAFLFIMERKVSRIIKRRTIANEACDAGRVMINGKVVKAGAEVKIGDIIEIQFGNNTTKIEVLDLKESTKKEDAVNMYKSL